MKGHKMDKEVAARFGGDLRFFVSMRGMWWV